MRQVQLLALLATLAASPGCLWISAKADAGAQITESSLAGIVVGETTKAEVLARLGPPEEFLRTEVGTALDDQEARVSRAVQLGNRAHDVFTWQFDRLRAHGQFWLLYLWVEAKVDSDLLMITFDDAGRVRDASMRRADVE